MHRKLGSCTVLELLLDGSTFATKELNVPIAYSPQLNSSAYLLPFRGRILRWRDGAAGTAISDKDFQRFLKTGFRTMPRIAIWDFLCELEHVLKAGLGKSLKDFQLTFEFRVMEHGHVRYWSVGSQQWFRVEAPPTGLQTCSECKILFKPTGLGGQTL